MRSSKKRHALHPLLCSISPPQKENAIDVISHNSYFVHVTLSFPYKYTSANAEEETQAVCKIKASQLQYHLKLQVHLHAVPPHLY